MSRLSNERSRRAGRRWKGLLPVTPARTVLAALALAACGTADAQVSNPEEQIAQALLAAPAGSAADARVLGYATDGSVVELRKGASSLVCLAADPARERFSVSCYHESLEPYFARGRELSADSVAHEERYRIRWEEMESGALSPPAPSATQYIFDGSWDAATRTGDGRVRWVIYVPGATAAATGLSPEPQPGGPWIMHPGTPGAHIMIVPPSGG